MKHVLVAAVLAFVAGGCAPAPAPQIPLPEIGEDGHAHYMVIPGLDLGGIAEEDRRQLLLDANHSHCECGCGMTVAQCLVTDPDCPNRENLFAELRRKAELLRKSR
jgi:hypothetical protein